MLLPEQAQRALDSYTATARVEATQAAHATETEQVARASSTAARQGTLDALEAHQTDVAVSLTQGAGLALATDAAAVRTQAANETRTWAAATGAALAGMVQTTATASARQAAGAAVDARRAQTFADAWDWLLLLVGAAVLLGLAVALVFGVSDLLTARAAVLRADAERAEAESRLLWIMQFGGALLQLRDDAWELMQAAPAGGPVIDGIVPRLSPVREVPMRTKSEVHLVQLDTPETPERQRVLDLLDAAIRAAGAHSTLIPSAARLGMHPQDWQNAIDSLKAAADRPAYVLTRTGRPKAGQGGGTQLCQAAYPTLGMLRDGVKRGDVLPRPIEQDESSAPGNIHNVISERL